MVKKLHSVPVALLATSLTLTSTGWAQPVAAPAGEPTTPSTAPAPEEESSATATSATSATSASPTPTLAASAPTPAAEETPSPAPKEPPVEPTRPAAPPPDQPEPTRENKKSNVDISGYLYTQLILSNVPDEPLSAFRVRNARVQLEWSQRKLFDAVIEADLGDDEEDQEDWAPLRDAYVEFGPHDLVHLRLGQFKKPFSGMALLSKRALPLVNRGLADDWVVETLGYGERDAGAALLGTIGQEAPRLKYKLGVFNGSGRNLPEQDLEGEKDFVGRLEGELTEWLTVAGGASHKRFPEGVGAAAGVDHATMFGADVELDHDSGLHAFAEGMYGDNYLSMSQYKSLAALLFVSYTIPLWKSEKVAVEPLVMGEILQVEDKIKDSHILGAMAGANLHVGKRFRLMIQGEMSQVSRSTPSSWDDEQRVFVQAAIHTD